MRTTDRWQSGTTVVVALKGNEPGSKISPKNLAEKICGGWGEISKDIDQAAPRSRVPAGPGPVTKVRPKIEEVAATATGAADQAEAIPAPSPTLDAHRITKPAPTDATTFESVLRNPPMTSIFAERARQLEFAD
jgi:hypothetical protein